MVKPPLVNLGLFLWIAVDAGREIWAATPYPPGERVVSFLIVAMLATTGAFVLRRAPARESDFSPRAVAIVAATTLCPLLYLLRPPAPPDWSALGVRIAASLLLLASAASLGRNFAVLPALRGIATRGPYRLIRHPLYAGYLLFDLGEWVAQRDVAGALIWLCEAVLLDYRAALEERLLAADPSYLAYRQTVRWRFLPGVR